MPFDEPHEYPTLRLLSMIPQVEASFPSTVVPPIPLGDAMRFVCLVLLLTLAGCTGQVPAAAPPSTSKSIWQGTSVKEPPAITEPALDVNAFDNAVCEIIDRDWLEGFGVSRVGTADSDEYGEFCKWPAVNPDGANISVTLRGRQGGLHRVYLNDAQYKYFKPGNISGYPSVVATPKDWPDYSCVTHVGTADHVGFETSASVRDPFARNPCTDSNAVAAAVIEQLKKWN